MINSDLKLTAKRVPISVVAERVGIHYSGSSYSKNLKALCPFHTEKTPSFMMNVADNSFRCFGCGVHGDTIDLVMKKLSLSFPAALEFLSGGNISTSDPGNAVISENHHPVQKMTKARKFEILQYAFNLYRPIYGKALQYMHERGLSDQSLNYLNVRSNDDPYGVSTALQKSYRQEELVDSGLFGIGANGKTYFRFLRYPIVFPSFKYGRVVSFRCRSLVSSTDDSLKDKRWMGLGAGIHPFFFNFDVAMESSSHAVIHATEGPTDLCSLRELVISGYFKSKSLPFGNLIPTVESPIIGYPAVSQFDDEVLMALSGRTLCLWIDAGGLALRSYGELKQKARKYNIKIRNMRRLEYLPNQFKDVNELLCHTKLA